MQLLCQVLMSSVLLTLYVCSGGFVQLPILIGREPRAMHNLARGLVRCRDVRHGSQPTVAHGCLQHLPQSYSFVMQRASRRYLFRTVFGLGETGHSIFLDCARVDRGQCHLPKERDQMKLDPAKVIFDPTLIALSFGQDLVLCFKLPRRVSKGLFTV